MEFIFEQTKTFRYDTSIERDRIKNSFKGARWKKAREMLLKLMDAIDAMDFVKAKKILDDKWWEGHAESLGSSRMEFIGLPGRIRSSQDGLEVEVLDFCFSYSDLVRMALRDNPDTRTRIYPALVTKVKTA